MEPQTELETDNKPLQLIYRNPRSRPPARIERWLLRLADYNFTVKHLPGKENPSDYMSPHPHFPPTTLYSQIAEDYVNFLTHHTVPKAITLSEIEEHKKIIQCKQLDLLFNKETGQISLLTTNHKSTKMNS